MSRPGVQQMTLHKDGGRGLNRKRLSSREEEEILQPTAFGFELRLCPGSPGPWPHNHTSQFLKITLFVHTHTHTLSVLFLWRSVTNTPSEPDNHTARLLTGARTPRTWAVSTSSGRHRPWPRTQAQSKPPLPCTVASSEDQRPSLDARIPGSFPSSSQPLFPTLDSP